MRIEVISICKNTEGGEHLSKRAWDESRGTSDSALESVLRVNAPVNELPSAVMNITSTILEREVITCLKDHVMWSTSSRVDDVTQFNLSAFVSDEGDQWAEDQREKMRVAKRTGMDQDDFRLHLPILSVTSYMVRLSLRSMVMLRQQFLMMAEGVCGYEPVASLQKIFYDASKQLEKVIEEFASFELSYPHTDIIGTPPFVVNQVVSTARVGSFIVFKGLVPFSLRTHMIRHRMLDIRDELRDIINGEHVEKFCIGNPMHVCVSGSRDAWVGIAGKRTCWLAHEGMWRTVLDPVMSYGGIDMEDVLPCKDGHCPYEEDIRMRREGRDPNPPCPRHARLQNYELTENQLARVRAQIESGEKGVQWKRYTGK